MEEFQASPCWPVILSKSLEKCGIHSLLVQNHRVKVSDAIDQGLVIFPLSSVAFMVVPLTQVVMEIQGRTTLTAEIIKRIERLNQIHRRGYVSLVYANGVTDGMTKALTALQSRFLGTTLRLIPANGLRECVDCMTMIAKVTCKPVAGIVQERMQKLKETTVNDDVVLQVLSTVGLSNHECLVLQHGCKTLSVVSQATEEELMDCSLDQHTAQKVIGFFEKDCIQI